MATVVQPKPITVEQFIARHRDDNRYELIDGEVFDLEPTSPHEKVAAFIDRIRIYSSQPSRFWPQASR